MSCLYGDFINIFLIGAQALACSCTKECRLKPAPQKAVVTSCSRRFRWECIPCCDFKPVCIPTQEHGNKMDSFLLTFTFKGEGAKLSKLLEQLIANYFPVMYLAIHQVLFLVKHCHVKIQVQNQHHCSKIRYGLQW